MKRCRFNLLLASILFGGDGVGKGSKSGLQGGGEFRVGGNGGGIKGLSRDWQGDTEER